ncbi:MAG: L-rhamnose/proton symporter RhaT [Bacteroidales bacterium]|nr:L-rhamnose/proton symporter RhaT [Bacteroidales bacterium]
MELVIGIVFATLAGLGAGTSAWPFKVIKEMHFEQYVFLNILSGLVLYPWIVVLIKVPDPGLMIETVGAKTLIISNILSVAWGVANLLCMICIIRIGAALTGAILSALGMSVGIIVPLILKGSGLFTNAPDVFSRPGLLIMIGLLVVIAGVVLVSVAGFGREKVLKNASGQVRKKQASGDFRRGLVLAIIAGILSCGLGLSFVYSQGPIIEAVKQQGAGEMVANVAVWALACLGGALVNIGYAVYWMTRKKTWNLLFIRKDELICSLLVGLQFLGSMVLMGRGMVMLGILGASVGFGIQQSMQIIGNQMVGFIGGEWKGVFGQPRKTMYVALGVIFIAVIVLAYSNTII